MEKQNTKIKRIIFKIALYGDNMVGTTSLLQRYLYNSFDPNFYNRYTEFYSHIIHLDNGKDLKIQFWDIFYSRYSHFNYFKNVDGVMLTYDKTNRKSFDNLYYLLRDVNNYTYNIPIALIGCKDDLIEREEITREEGEKFANDNNLLFFETSAKEDYNVIECFNGLITRIYENKKNDIENVDNEIYLMKTKRNPKRGCLK